VIKGGPVARGLPGHAGFLLGQVAAVAEPHPSRGGGGVPSGSTTVAWTLRAGDALVPCTTHKHVHEPGDSIWSVHVRISNTWTPARCTQVGSQWLAGSAPPPAARGTDRSPRRPDPPAALVVLRAKCRPSRGALHGTGAEVYAGGPDRLRRVSGQ